MSKRNELIDALIELGENKEELEGMETEDIECMYDDMTDTSWAHPNETFDEFMEHEEF